MVRGVRSSARRLAIAAAGALLVVFTTGGSCGEASNPDSNCGDTIYTPSSYPPAGDLEIESGYTTTGYAVSFSKTYDDLCLARSDEFNKLTCAFVLKGAAAAGLPADHTVSCSVYHAVAIRPYTAPVVQDAAHPETYSATVKSIGLQQGAQQRGSTTGKVIGSARIEYPMQGGGDAANRAYADTIIQSVTLTPNFLKTKPAAP